MVKLIADIETADPSAGVTTNGMTDEKHTNKVLFIAAFFTITSAIFAYADRSENAELKNTVDFPISDLESYREETLLKVYNAVAEWLKTHLTELADYGVTKAEVDNLAVLKTNFFKKSPSIRATVTDRMAVNEMLGELFSKADKKLVNQADRLMERFSSTNVKFYNAYWFARNFIDYGVRHDKPETGTSTTLLLPPSSGKSPDDINH